MAIINKTLAGISFSENTSLNIVSQDLMESGLEFSISGDNFTELNGLAETILSMNAYARTSTTIHIRADSPKYEIWKDRFFSNGAIEGTATLTFDNGATWTLKKMRIAHNDYSANGTSGDGVFTLSGDIQLNTDLIV